MTTDLRVWLLGAQRRGALLDALGQTRDRHDGALCGSCQLLLVASCAGHQRLRVFDQRLGRLQDVLSAAHTHTCTC